MVENGTTGGNGISPNHVSLAEHVTELIRRASTDLPEDVVEAIERSRALEDPGSSAHTALGAILDNIALARTQSTPICQDTGTLIFRIHYPFGWSTLDIARDVKAGVAEATAKYYLRPNCVHPLTGKISTDNIGIDYPTMHFEEWGKDYLRFDLILKGGGCENVGVQYSLPFLEIDAGRDLTGVKKVVLHAIHSAQGMGCGPGIIGVGIGGDRGSSYWLSKQQLYRRLDDTNEIPELADAEAELFELGNQLDIGPMGFGGHTTVLAVKMGIQHRLPASFFVSMSYMCWADRKQVMIVRDDDVSYDEGVS